MAHVLLADTISLPVDCLRHAWQSASLSVSSKPSRLSVCSMMVMVCMQLWQVLLMRRPARATAGSSGASYSTAAVIGMPC